MLVVQVTVGQWRLCLHLLQRMLDLELRTDQVQKG